jgi:hypothetical protein
MLAVFPQGAMAPRIHIRGNVAESGATQINNVNVGTSTLDPKTLFLKARPDRRVPRGRAPHGRATHRRTPQAGVLWACIS